MKSIKNIAHITCNIEVPYCPYKNKKMNKKAEQCIKKWIKEILQSEASFIPLYVEKDDNGSAIEDCAKLSKIEVIINGSK